LCTGDERGRDDFHVVRFFKSESEAWDPVERVPGWFMIAMQIFRKSLRPGTDALRWPARGFRETVETVTYSCGTAYTPLKQGVNEREIKIVRS